MDSLCPYCGVGCQLTYHVKDDSILYVEGRDGPANHSRLCVKGRYGFDYSRHPQRLTKPLIRRRTRRQERRISSWIPTTSCRCSARPPGRRRSIWRAARSRDCATPTAAKSLAGFGSAKGSNEEAYLFQKLVRLGFGSNNVDHCTRLCHASSVAALLEGIGSGAVSNPVMDVTKASVVILIGANPTVNHPVAATFLKNAMRNGTKLIVMDPRRSELARTAYRLPAVQARHRRGASQRDDARHRRGEPGRREVHRRPHPGLRGAGEERGGLQPGTHGADLRHPRGDHPRSGAAVRDQPGLDDPLGHGYQPAHSRHRQCALPDRAGADDRPDRQAGHRDCIRCAARTTSRAHRMRV